MLLDVKMPEMDGFETAQLIRQRKRSAHTPIIFITAHGDVAMAVQAMRAGAYDFIEKPPNADKILLSVRNALEMARLTEENRRLRQQHPPAKEIIGKSAAMQKVYETILKAAQAETDAKVEAVAADIKVLMDKLAAIPTPGMTPEQEAALADATAHAQATLARLTALDDKNP